MQIEPNIARLIRGLSVANYSDSEYEEVLGMILERAFEETLEAGAVKQEVKQSTPKKTSSVPAKDTLLRHVYDSVLAGVGTAHDIRVHLESIQIPTTEQRTSAALVSLERRGLLVRTGRGSYAVVAQ